MADQGAPPQPANIESLCLESPDISLLEKLKRGILYLNRLKATDIPKFIAESNKIMNRLTLAFKELDSKSLYLPWVRFLDIAHKIFKVIRKAQDREDFKLS